MGTAAPEKVDSVSEMRGRRRAEHAHDARAVRTSVIANPGGEPLARSRSRPSPRLLLTSPEMSNLSVTMLQCGTRVFFTHLHLSKALLNLERECVTPLPRERSACRVDSPRARCTPLTSAQTPVKLRWTRTRRLRHCTRRDPPNIVSRHWPARAFHHRAQGRTRTRRPTIPNPRAWLPPD